MIDIRGSFSRTNNGTPLFRESEKKLSSLGRVNPLVVTLRTKDRQCRHAQRPNVLRIYLG